MDDIWREIYRGVGIEESEGSPEELGMVSGSDEPGPDTSRGFSTIGGNGSRRSDAERAESHSSHRLGSKPTGGKTEGFISTPSEPFIRPPSQPFISPPAQPFIGGPTPEVSSPREAAREAQRTVSPTPELWNETMRDVADVFKKYEDENWGAGKGETIDNSDLDPMLYAAIDYSPAIATA